MKLLVFFDLPVSTKEFRKKYARFRKYLLKDGYSLIQYSIYARTCNGLDGTQKHIQRLKYFIPQNGHIRALIVTEKQFSEMLLLLGEKNNGEKKHQSKDLQLQLF